MGAVDTLSSVFSGLGDWAKHPFTVDMNLWDWALFTGLIIVLSILWLMVLHDLKGEL